jgi:hypothetical protein
MVKAEGLASLWRGHVASQMLSVSYCAIQVRRRLQERERVRETRFIASLPVFPLHSRSPLFCGNQHVKCEQQLI